MNIPPVFLLQFLLMNNGQELPAKNDLTPFSSAVECEHELRKQLIEQDKNFGKPQVYVLPDRLEYRIPQRTQTVIISCRKIN